MYRAGPRAAYLSWDWLFASVLHALRNMCASSISEKRTGVDADFYEITYIIIIGPLSEEEE